MNSTLITPPHTPVSMRASFPTMGRDYNVIEVDMDEKMMIMRNARRKIARRERRKRKLVPTPVFNPMYTPDDHLDSYMTPLRRRL
jgi:hypothetical protein